jgi:hypothetical protein
MHAQGHIFLKKINDPFHNFGYNFKIPIVETSYVFQTCIDLIRANTT